MAAAEKTATAVGGPVGSGAAVSSNGLVEGVYTVTAATTLDWVILSEFDEVKYVHALKDADGVDAEAYIDSTTTNKVFITGTGACTLFVKGTPA